MRQFFLAPKTYVKIDGLENIYNFTPKIFVYLNLCIPMYIQGSHKLWKSWKTWKITKKSSMHGKVMEFEKT